MHYDEIDEAKEYESELLAARRRGKTQMTSDKYAMKQIDKIFDPEYRYGEYIKKVYDLYTSGGMPFDQWQAACRPEPKARRFAFMRVFKIYERDSDVLYLWRLRILETPWFGLMLHKIIRPDPDRHMHDHPWPFFSLILKGSYEEESRDASCEECASYEGHFRTCIWTNKKRADSARKIMYLFKSPVWTLVFRGKRCRTWGFHTENGWIPWHIYLNAQEKQ